jgi:hypothetical protein
LVLLYILKRNKDHDIKKKFQPLINQKKFYGINIIETAFEMAGKVPQTSTEGTCFLAVATLGV